MDAWPAVDPPLAAGELLTALFRAVSHDLQSPLLTVSLGVELLGDGDGDGDTERARVGRESMAHGVRELGRLLEAVTVLSRARTRILHAQPVSLQDLFRGHVVVSDADLMDAVTILDTRCVAELLAALAPGSPAELRLSVWPDHMVGSLALPPGVEIDVEASYPMQLVVTSLQQHAGTPLVAAASAQTQLERQGGALVCAGGRLHIRIPLVSSGRPAGASR